MPISSSPQYPWSLAPSRCLQGLVPKPVTVSHWPLFPFPTGFSPFSSYDYLLFFLLCSWLVTSWALHSLLYFPAKCWGWIPGPSSSPLVLCLHIILLGPTILIPSSSLRFFYPFLFLTSTFGCLMGSLNHCKWNRTCSSPRFLYLTFHTNFTSSTPSLNWSLERNISEIQKACL